MRTLYKYSNKLPTKYLLNPTIKLSIPTYLNDPFENIITEDVLNLIFTDPSTKGSAEKFMQDNIMNRQEFTSHVFHCLRNCGVVSLTETPRNLLMWAHYGNQHNGICIGYKENFLNEEFKSQKMQDKNLPHFYMPQKISYDTKRFDINESKIIKSKNETLIYNLLAHVLTVKSDEWIYEKEHRCIVPISYSDKYITERPYFNTRNSENGYIPISKGEKIVFNNGFLHLENGSNEHKCLAPERTMIFKSISPKMIDSIYLGCKVDVRYRCDIIDLITSNPDTLGHIKVFSFTPDPNRFELNAEPCL